MRPINRMGGTESFGSPMPGLSQPKAYLDTEQDPLGIMKVRVKELILP